MLACRRIHRYYRERRSRDACPRPTRRPSLSPTLRPACKEGSCVDPTYLPHFSYSPPATADSLRGRPVIGRRTFLAGTCAMLLATPLAAEAQQAGKVYRIGFLRAGPPPKAYVEAFQQGLRARGYIDGVNVVIEYRATGGSYEDLPRLAAELVRLKVHVI